MHKFKGRLSGYDVVLGLDGVPFLFCGRVSLKTRGRAPLSSKRDLGCCIRERVDSCSAICGYGMRLSNS